MKKYFLLIIPILANLILCAQGDISADNNDMMRSNHKIYVVAAVLAIILTAIFIFLFSIERRLKKLENSPSANR